MVRRGLANCSLNPGELLSAQRDTPYGLLQWRITVRDDGRTECAGALPSLIEWRGPHPSEHLAPTDLALKELVLRGVPPQALDVLNLPSIHTGPVDNLQDAPVSATLDSPRGRVVLDAWHTAG